MVQNPVVAADPIGEATANIFSCGAGLQSEVRMREISRRSVQLRRKVVAFRLSFSPHQPCLLFALMKVMRNRAEVIEEFTVDRPPMITAPDIFADQSLAFSLDCVLQAEPLTLEFHETETFIRRAVLVHGKRRGRNPTLINSSPLRTIRIDIARVQLQSSSRNKVGSRNPGRREP